MPFDLTALIANQLAETVVPPSVPAALESPLKSAARLRAAAAMPNDVDGLDDDAGGGVGSSVISPSALPVFQLSSFPIALTPSLYANPRTNSNPNGTLTTLYAFRQLIDPVPSFTEYYSPAATSTEIVYNNLVHGASVTGSSNYAQQVLASAQMMFDLAGIPNLDGTPYKWRPIYATPGDWYDVSQSSRFISMDLDVSASNTANHPYIVLGDAQAQQQLSWRIGNNETDASSVPLDTNTNLQAIQLKYLQVNLTRPWLDFEIFGLNSWYLQGQASGYCSTGNVNSNGGVLPLLPVSLIIGLDTTLTANLGSADQSLIHTAVAANKFVSLGPFVLQTGAQQPSNSGGGITFRSVDVVAAPQTLYVVGWFSTLVPLSPAIASP